MNHAANNVDYGAPTITALPSAFMLLSALSEEEASGRCVRRSTGDCNIVQRAEPIFLPFLIQLASHVPAAIKATCGDDNSS